MPDGPSSDDEDLPRFVLDLDDIADADELALPEVREPAKPLAYGSELRSRVISQQVPSDLDLALMAYLLDIDVPVELPPVSEDESVDESPTPKYPPRP